MTSGGSFRLELAPPQLGPFPTSVEEAGSVLRPGDAGDLVAGFALLGAGECAPLAFALRRVGERLAVGRPSGRAREPVVAGSNGPVHDEPLAAGRLDAGQDLAAVLRVELATVARDESDFRTVRLGRELVHQIEIASRVLLLIDG